MNELLTSKTRETGNNNGKEIVIVIIVIDKQRPMTAYKYVQEQWANFVCKCSLGAIVYL